MKPCVKKRKTWKICQFMKQLKRSMQKNSAINILCIIFRMTFNLKRHRLSNNFRQSMDSRTQALMESRC